MDDIEIAAKAAAGDPDCRKLVNDQVHPIICAKSAKFCKTYCQTNRYRYLCTLAENAWPAPFPEAAYCEWGNGSYSWMLDDLTKPRRLQKYQAKHGASLREYLNTIANSLAFKERWKDWRFNRRINVPVCVKRLHDEAAKVFFALYNQKSCEEIAPQLGLSLTEVQDIADKILITLTQENKLYLLTPPSEVSLTGLGCADDEEDQGIEGQIAFYDIDAADKETRDKITNAWQKLNPAEQFVLESTIIDGEDANTVLDALKQVGIALKKGVPAENTDRQQLYHFRRKTLKKLAELTGLKD